MSTSNAPRVSVVIPAYKNVDYLPQAIDSVLAQDFSDYELVVADHSSADGSEEILARYADHPKVRVLSPTPSGGGAPANWRRVAEHAQGRYIKLVCGDDLIEPQSLRLQSEALDSDQAIVLVASKRRLIDAAGKQIMAARGLGSLRGRVSGREAVRASVRAGTNLFGEPGCVMMRRDVFEQVGGWDAEFPYLIDQASYTRVMLRGDMVALPESLASFRISAGQWSVRLVNDQAKQAVAFHDALYERHPGVLSAMDRRIGNLRAWQMAYMRRAAYAWLRQRM